MTTKVNIGRHVSVQWFKHRGHQPMLSINLSASADDDNSLYRRREINLDNLSVSEARQIVQELNAAIREVEAVEKAASKND